jgi:pimeloyl-ACP methyl ester carboxylesterase
VKSEFTEKRINLSQSHLFYLEGGKKSNSDPILFIHGWSVSTLAYQSIFNALAKNHYIIAPDLPNFGKSTSTKSLATYKDYVDCLIEFAHLLNLKKVHLVGHSLGGAISIILATIMPSLVSSVVVLDSTGIPLGYLAEVMLRRSFEIVAQMPMTKPEPLSNIVQAFLYNSLFQTGNVIQAAQISLDEDIRPFLPHVESPCLVLWGENDLFTPLNMGQEIAQGIKGSQLRVIEGVYHEWSLFRAEELAALIFDFLEQVELNS